MSENSLEKKLKEKLDVLARAGRLKGAESVITEIISPSGEKGTRYLLDGHGSTEFIRMNSNSYLGISRREELISADEESSKKFGSGPGAVRFISGTYLPHVLLEKRLAEFHSREAAIVFSSAYSAVMGVIPQLVDKGTAVLTDELNHNSIINAIRLSRPDVKEIYSHNDMTDLEEKLKLLEGICSRVLIVTDGIFSMRGDHAPLHLICRLKNNYAMRFPEGITLIVDDSHGIGALGKTGRGTEEYTGAEGVDILISTLGKAIGVNGGYVVSSSGVIQFLRETAPFYIYSNPVTPGEASAALAALKIIDSDTGIHLLEKLQTLTARLETGLKNTGCEILESSHPIVPVLIRDTVKCTQLVRHLLKNRIMATGITHPVVPEGEDEIRLQVNADHTADDIDYVIGVFKEYIR